MYNSNITPMSLHQTPHEACHRKISGLKNDPLHEKDGGVDIPIFCQ